MRVRMRSIVAAAVVLITAVVYVSVSPTRQRPMEAPPARPRLHVRTGAATTCLANVGRVGKALLLYAGDCDDQLPHGTQYPEPVTATYGLPRTPVHGCGWAGQVFPYIGVPDALTCPEDPTEAFEPAVAVSYGLNDAVAGPSRVSGIPDARAVVLLFQVAGAAGHLCRARGNGHRLISR